jgi:hypothetical protein
MTEEKTMPLDGLQKVAFTDRRDRPDAEPYFLPHPVMDQLIDVVLALGAELWVERDRRRIAEKLLAEKGLLSPAAIETYRETTEERELRAKERDAFVRRIYGALNRKPEER